MLAGPRLVFLAGSLLCVNSTVLGFGERRRTAYAVDPCWPMAPVYAPASPMLAPVPQPMYGTRLPSPYIRDYAVPIPAPPSAQPIEPGPNVPRVIESRSRENTSQVPPARPSDYEAFYFAPETPLRQKGGEDSPAVSFWNLSERNVSLQVQGRTYALGRGRQLSLRLPRTFRWQVGQRDPVAMEVPAGKNGMEIVIRR